jgi:Zn-dependent protease
LVGIFNLLPIYELDGMRIFNIVKKWLQIVIFMVKYLVKI